MIRLTKGAKETFGWVVVGQGREVAIPPAAWERYGFKAGEVAVFIPGSKKSGGFGITNIKLLERLSIPMDEDRILGWGKFSDGKGVQIPAEIPVHTGDRLLTVFGSCYALGMVAKGPIYKAALGHPELGVSKMENPRYHQLVI